ncbi:hypothetical protein BDD12DRAFT_802618 [Trichophaea hybrida]|nr:hypothetical protein BDD12DRAFT_802618 [Trichophaea hybrida]
MLSLRGYALLIVLRFGLSTLAASSRASPVSFILKNNTISGGVAINHSSSGSVYNLEKYPFDNVREEEWSQRVVPGSYDPESMTFVQGFAKERAVARAIKQLCQRAVRNGRCAGHFVGILFGSRLQLKSMNGTLVIGGYDNGRKDPDADWKSFHISPRYLASPCPLQVLISDVRLSFEDGSQHSLFAETGKTILACIGPQRPQFTFTKAMTDRLKNLTEYAIQVPGTGPNFTDHSYPASKKHLMHSLSGFE